MDASPQWGRIRGIILDAVGTLIEAAPPVATVYAEVARSQGVLLDGAEIWTRFRKHFGDDEADDFRGPMTTDEAREHRRWQRIVASVLPELPDQETGFAHLWEHFGRPSAWRTFDDVGPALRWLSRAGLVVCVGSNFDSRLRQVVGGLPALSGWEDRLVISSEVGYRKPHPAFYEAACRVLGLPKEQVLCIGDDLENDVRGPLRAGLQAIRVARRSAHDHEPGVPTIPDLSGLSSLLVANGDDG